MLAYSIPVLVLWSLDVSIYRVGQKKPDCFLKVCNSCMKTVQFFWPTLYVAAITLLLIELCGAKQGSVCKISLAGITKVSVGKSQEV